MNLLTELHERLAYSAVAGTALLEDDFRLKKLMDGFAPLAQKNPVFAKIFAGLQQLFQAEEAQRGKLLLNLLGLVDAVRYTQAGLGTAGELVPLPEGESQAAVQQIRYSALNPLVTALTTTGSGRMEVLSDAIREHPEYLSDYRVVAALIEDLNDPYGDMATLVFDVLKALGTEQTVKTEVFLDGICKVRYHTLPKVNKEQLIVQLKWGFDPEGKTDMLRRLMLIITIAGAEQNDWYLSILETAKKDIRALAVFALGCKEENVPLLFELVKKEHGKAKEMACRALCQWETPEVVAFLEQTLEKNPKLASCLSDTTNDVYGDLVAKGLRTQLEKIIGEPHIPRKQMEDIIMPWITALLGKSSEGVIALYRWVFALEQLPKIQETTYNKQTQEIGMLPLFYEQICETLVLTCPQSLVDFLNGQRSTWGEASFLADLFTKSAAEVYNKWSGQTGDAMHHWMQSISDKLLVTRTKVRAPWKSDHDLKRPIKEPLDVRWIDVFIKNDWEDMFTRIDTATLSEEWKQRAGAYFYKKALKVEKGGYYVNGSLRIRLYRMLEYGWQDYENILVNLCRSYSNIAKYQIYDMFTTYQEILGKEATAQEAERVVEFYRTTSEKDSKKADIVAQMLKALGFLKDKGEN